MATRKRRYHRIAGRTVRLGRLTRRIKRENPKIVRIMEKLQISQEQYEKAMRAMLSAETLPRNTNATATSEIHYGQLQRHYQ